MYFVGGVGLYPGEDQERLVEYPPYDGWYNNYAHPGWGGADTQLFRKVPPAYSDGTYEPSGQDRPSPMNLSRIVFTGPTGYKSYKGRTAFMVFFGQQLVEEILDAQRAGCPPEYINLDIPKEHEHYSENPKFVNVLPVLRTRYDMKTGLTPNNPRQQLNEISAWMDGTLVYGPNKAWTDSIREFKDGLLQVDDTKGPYGGEFPRNNSIRLPYINPPPPRDHPKIKPISRFNKIGNPRGNENPFLLTMGIMWFRYHNAWARKLKDQHPDWSDEKLFNEARKMVVGVYQKITTKDWLPQWLGKELEPYSGYNPTVHPGVAHVFQSAAMRFGHTMVPPGVYRRNNDCIYRKTTKRTHFEDKVAIRTCNSFWNPQEAVYEYDIDEFIMGMASQIAEREDNIITPDLRGNVFGPLEFNRRDLMAINIQRARDHGIPDFNSVRKAYGLSPKTWDNLIVHRDIDSDGKILSQLKELYNDDFGKIDLWVAGMLEVNEGPGETFRAIIGDQFQRIRDGDRFWYENENNRFCRRELAKIQRCPCVYDVVIVVVVIVVANVGVYFSLYTKEEVQLIETISIKEVIMNTTTIGLRDIQDNPFIFKDGDPCPTPHQLNHSSGLMEDCTEKQTFDYFSGSEVSFVISLIILFSTFFIFLGILWLVARHHNKVVERERAKIRQKTVSHADRQRNERFFAVSEWQGPKEKWQNVKIELNQAKKIILVKSTNNQLLRTIDLKCMLSRGERTMDCYLSVDKQMDLTIIKIPREYDLFLRFDTVRERQDFIDAFKKFLKGEPALSSAKSASTKQMFQLAVTKEVRKGNC
ncbi:hypothetical protein LSH36_60g05053 [Paralvinella palmiformis]|uniref:Uncharacterized protein n=1 Tax=Paralvinella palmiformis TaxID=53620 RepID=A0AAD9K4D5_9ANNE|nr:hypothetical protein LSH36_60g05053 [Paralvinella palmiformis]